MPECSEHVIAPAQILVGAGKLVRHCFGGQLNSDFSLYRAYFIYVYFHIIIHAIDSILRIQLSVQRKSLKSGADRRHTIRRSIYYQTVKLSTRVGSIE